MSRPRVALLNAALDGEHTTRNFRRELDADLVEYSVSDGHVPATTDFDGVVVTGSASSVYWDEEWIRRTKAWTAEAVDAGLPCLGICWGHQLLAEVCGGRVADMGEYEIGYRTVERTGDSRLLEGLDDAFTVFTTHSDAVVELPPGAELIAENDYGVHGFRTGRVYGVQFHPEYDMETAESVTRDKDLDPDRRAAVLAGVDEETYRAACEAKALFENFLAIVRETRRGDGARGRAAGD